MPHSDRDLGRANRLLDEASDPRRPSGLYFPRSILYDASFAKRAEVLRDQLGEGLLGIFLLMTMGVIGANRLADLLCAYLIRAGHMEVERSSISRILLTLRSPV